MMQRTISTIGLLLCAAMISAQTPKDVKFRFTEANDLTMTGRLFSDNPNPYHRVDTERFKGFVGKENLQVRETSGMACMFTTNSSVIFGAWDI